MVLLNQSLPAAAALLLQLWAGRWLPQLICIQPCCRYFPLETHGLEPGRRGGGRGGCPVSLQEKVMGLCLPGAGQQLVGAVQESGVKDVLVLCAVWRHWYCSIACWVYQPVYIQSPPQIQEDLLFMASWGIFSDKAKIFYLGSCMVGQMSLILS